MESEFRTEFQEIEHAIGAVKASAHKKKVSKDEYVRHRKEASTLKSYTVRSITQHGDTAEARVDLTFDKSQKLKRDRPVLASVTEDLVLENGQWKIKVW